MLRVAAINFLNPAPLMWDFEHAPLAAELAVNYSLHYTQPSQCAAELLAARADLGLIPIASLTPELAIVPGCTIASLNEVRSIQLIIKSQQTLDTRPTFLPATADPIAMLQHADAAILIGDPALLALEAREQIEATIGPCQ